MSQTWAVPWLALGIRNGPGRSKWYSVMGAMRILEPGSLALNLALPFASHMIFSKLIF